MEINVHKLAPFIQLSLDSDTDFKLICSSRDIEDLPGHILAEYPDIIHLGFSADYHKQSVLQVGNNKLDLVVSFDALYPVTIPYKAVLAFIVSPDGVAMDPEGPDLGDPDIEEEPASAPHLRLVK